MCSIAQKVSSVIILDLQAYTTPELETPDYSILYKAAQYEVRSYQPYLVSETSQPSGAGPASGSGFQELAGYLFGGNEASESMAMTTPVFTKPAIGMGAPDSAKMQFVMERRYSQDSVPAPKAGAKIVTRTEEGGIKAVATFAGFPLDFEVCCSSVLISMWNRLSTFCSTVYNKSGRFMWPQLADSSNDATKNYDRVCVACKAGGCLGRACSKA